MVVSNLNLTSTLILAYCVNKTLLFHSLKLVKVCCIFGIKDTGQLHSHDVAWAICELNHEWCL